MKRLPSYILAVICCLILSSCEKSAYKGFDKMKNGAYMRFYEVNAVTKMPMIGDHVIVAVKQTLGDSLFYSSENEENGTMEFEITGPSFVGDMMAGLLNMHLYDSATIAFPVDSMCVKTLGMPTVPDYLTPGTPVFIDIRLKEIISAEDVAARREYELQMMQQYDEDCLAMYYSDANNTVTKNGLIILSVKGNGRGAKDGEILTVNFNLISIAGDTLLDLFNREPVAVRCGDTELGDGFAEAMKYVPEGGEAHFVIPSSRAFGSEGFENIIPPYTSFVLNIKNTKIYSEAEYAEEQKRRQEAEDAENQKRLDEEPARIAKFVRDHNVNVTPSATGVYYLEIASGSGAVADNGDIVSIYYNLYNVEDKLIESNFGDEPLTFVYGTGTMVPGIEEALQHMRVGGKATIIVPSTMGFGDIAIDEELPANSTVIFDIELVDVKKSH